MAIASLARIETFGLAVILGVFYLRTPRKLRFFAVPVIFVFAIYVAANIVIFGNPQPISGAVKLAWSDYYLAQNPIFQNQGWLAAKIDLALLPVRGLAMLRHLGEMLLPGYLVFGSYGAVILFALAWITDRLHWHRLYQRLEPLTPFIFYSLLNLVGYVVFFQGFLAYTPWYFVIQPWLAAITFAILFQAVTEWVSPRMNTAMARRAILSVTVLIGLGVGMYTLRSISFPISPKARSEDPLEKAALWLRDNTPRDAVVGSWNAGIISYYSQHRVVNLDGLVNSWDFFRHEQYDLCRYWKENRIEFIADVFEEQRALSPVPSYLYYKQCAGAMELVWSEDIQGISGRVQIYRLSW